jgi:hypothetical protein
MLVGDFGQRGKPRAQTTCENDAFHGWFLKQM